MAITDGSLRWDMHIQWVGFYCWLRAVGAPRVDDEVPLPSGSESEKLSNRNIEYTTLCLSASADTSVLVP